MPKRKQEWFDDDTLYGSLDGDAYGPDAVRLIVVARKPSPSAGE